MGQLPSYTNTFVNGTTAEAPEVNENFTEIKDAHNATDTSAFYADGSKDITGATFIDVNSDSSGLQVGTTRGFVGIATGSVIDNGTDMLFSTSRQMRFTPALAKAILDGVFLPGLTGSYDLGSSSLLWKDIFISGDINISNVTVSSGSGSPETVVTADPGSQYNDEGGNIYVKATGTGNTGWSNLQAPQNYLTGLNSENDAVDSDHDILINTGMAKDDTDTVVIKLSAATTKRTDDTFAEGTGQGGFAATETLPISGTIHEWVISKLDGTTDVFYNNHATSGLSPTLPTDFVYKRRNRSWQTDSSANIINGTWDGDDFWLNVPLQVSTGAFPNTGTLITVGTPVGIKIIPNLNIFSAVTGTDIDLEGLLTSPDQADTAPSSSVFNLFAGQDTGAALWANAGNDNPKVLTNTSGQVRIRYTSTSGTYTAFLHGWKDRRDR